MGVVCVQCKCALINDATSSLGLACPVDVASGRALSRRDLWPSPPPPLARQRLWFSSGGMAGTGCQCCWLCEGGPAPPTQEVGVWWNVINWCWLALFGCQNFLENRNKMWVCSGPSLPAQLPMHTVGYLLPHGCLSCGWQGRLCSTHLVSVGKRINAIYQFWLAFTTVLCSRRLVTYMRQVFNEVFSFSFLSLHPSLQQPAGDCLLLSLFNTLRAAYW